MNNGCDPGKQQEGYSQQLGVGQPCWLGPTMGGGMTGAKAGRWQRQSRFGGLQ